MEDRPGVRRPGPDHGQAAYLCKTAKAEEDAVRLLGKLLDQARIGRTPESDATVGYLLEQYLAVAQIEPSTWYLYEGHIRRIIRPVLGQVQLRTVRGRTLELLHARLCTCRDLCTERATPGHTCRPLAASTVRQLRAILSGAFGAAVRWEWLEHNPAEGVRLTTARPPEPEPPSPADVARLLRTAWEEDPLLAASARAATHNPS